jgi:hypothetical protein
MWNGNLGIFTAKLAKNAKNNHFCVSSPKVGLAADNNSK